MLRYEKGCTFLDRHEINYTPNYGYKILVYSVIIIFFNSYKYTPNWGNKTLIKEGVRRVHDGLFFFVIEQNKWINQEKSRTIINNISFGTKPVKLLYKSILDY